MAPNDRLPSGIERLIDELGSVGTLEPVEGDPAEGVVYSPGSPGAPLNRTPAAGWWEATISRRASHRETGHRCSASSEPQTAA